jgi:tRNA(fMet)-specific endonuclease VapC
MFLLDTDHISIEQKQQQPYYGQLLKHMQQHQPGSVFRSIVSFHEQIRGAHNLANQPKKPKALLHGYGLFKEYLEDYSRWQVLPFEHIDALMFDALMQKNIQIGTMDLRIAATALARNLTVVTMNFKDFKKVPGLQLDDWTK